MNPPLHLHRGPGRDGPALLVLHDVAGEHIGRGGSAWRDVLDAWPGPSAAPDLPGCGQSPPAEGGKVVPTDLALFALRALGQLGWGPDTRPVVLGHGWGAYAAEHLAAAGRSRALVLVDGLGGPWADADAAAAAQTAWLRSALELYGRPAATPDPILALGFPDVWDEAFTRHRRAAITVPVLILETPDSPTPIGERAARAAMFGGETTTSACTRAEVSGRVRAVTASR